MLGAVTGALGTGAPGTGRISGPDCGRRLGRIRFRQYRGRRCPLRRRSRRRVRAVARSGAILEHAQRHMQEDAGDQHRGSGNHELAQTRRFLRLRGSDRRALAARLPLGRRRGGGLRRAPRRGDEIRLGALLGGHGRLDEADGGFGRRDAFGGRRHGALAGCGAGLEGMIGRQIRIDRRAGACCRAAPRCRRMPCRCRHRAGGCATEHRWRRRPDLASAGGIGLARRSSAGSRADCLWRFLRRLRIA